MWEKTLFQRLSLIFVIQPQNAIRQLASPIAFFCLKCILITSKIHLKIPFFHGFCTLFWGTNKDYQQQNGSLNIIDENTQSILPENIVALKPFVCIIAKLLII